MSDLNLNLNTKNGDFELLNSQDSLMQNENLIILSDKGKFINNLLLGVGITKYLNGPSSIVSLKANIQNELQKDGIVVKSIEVINGEIYIKSYKK